jgi:hypothetical protein
VAAPPESEQDFARSWRAELLARAWQALARHAEETGRHAYQILRWKVDQGWSYDRLAEEVSRLLGKEVKAAAARQMVHRAREKFASFLLEDVRQSLADPTPDELAGELAELGLLSYCGPAIPAGHSASPVQKPEHPDS